MTTLGIDLMWDELDDELDDEIEPALPEDTNSDDMYDKLVEEEEDVFCKQCGALVEDGFQCNICGWMVEVL